MDEKVLAVTARDIVAAEAHYQRSCNRDYAKSRNTKQQHTEHSDKTFNITAYSSLEEIDTALCIDKLSSVDSDDVTLPSNVRHSVPTVLTFDNIERQEESLTGGGTPHRVNDIIFQTKSLKCVPHHTTSTVAKTDKKRSIQPSEKLLPVYSVGKREGPPTVKPADLSGTLADAASTAQRGNHLWVLTRLSGTV